MMKSSVLTNISLHIALMLSQSLSVSILSNNLFQYFFNTVKEFVLISPHLMCYQKADYRKCLLTNVTIEFVPTDPNFMLRMLRKNLFQNYFPLKFPQVTEHLMTF